MHVDLIGTGGGSQGSMILESALLLKNADLIIGAKRLLESLPDSYCSNRVAEIYASKIADIIETSGCENICVAFSGDSGFYSGATGLIPILEERGIDFSVRSGLSSVQLFASALKRPWQDWNLFSAHGTDIDPVSCVMQGRDSFFLTGGKLTSEVILRLLSEAGLGSLKAAVGENLSYPEQRVMEGTVDSLLEEEIAPLSVLLIEKAPSGPRSLPGVDDELYIRGKVPITKRDVRAVVVSHMKPDRDSVIWDVGAGTGGVSVELALAADLGKVYAVETNEEGIELIKQNREKFCRYNIVPVHGMAPEALADLPAPDRVFIGGSKKNMEAIVGTVHEKNPCALVCITAIALESLFEAMSALEKFGYTISVTQISSANAKVVGSYHMMMAENPIYILTGEKEPCTE
ncbi:MAG: precorrin-6Y C5,15-methyltransferase (decarboxylating) subunit CbiT [Eubacteriaceae bacterium]|nr:precorrin-6Y C5,15-methyltransferase (decarboxylating) subunit CbiT [Eubacteriaceae bacterium]